MMQKENDETTIRSYKVNIGRIDITDSSSRRTGVIFCAFQTNTDESKANTKRELRAKGGARSCIALDPLIRLFCRLGFTVLFCYEIKTNQLCVKTELTSQSANLCKR